MGMGGARQSEAERARARRSEGAAQGRRQLTSCPSAPAPTNATCDAAAADDAAVRKWTGGVMEREWESIVTTCMVGGGFV